MPGVALHAGGRAPRPGDGAAPVRGLGRLEALLLVEERVGIVHLRAGQPVGEARVLRDLLGEVRLEGVRAERELGVEQAAIPADGLGIREVDDGAEPHAALRALAPHQGVVDAAVRPAQEVPARHALLVERALAARRRG